MGSGSEQTRDQAGTRHDELAVGTELIWGIEHGQKQSEEGEGGRGTEKTICGNREQDGLDWELVSMTRIWPILTS